MVIVINKADALNLKSLHSHGYKSKADPMDLFYFWLTVNYINNLSFGRIPWAFSLTQYFLFDPAVHQNCILDTTGFTVYRAERRRGSNAGFAEYVLSVPSLLY